MIQTANGIVLKTTKKRLIAQNIICKIDSKSIGYQPILNLSARKRGNPALVTFVIVDSIL